MNKERYGCFCVHRICKTAFASGRGPFDKLRAGFRLREVTLGQTDARQGIRRAIAFSTTKSATEAEVKEKLSEEMANESLG
jgi:hypothetical protein